MHEITLDKRHLFVEPRLACIRVSFRNLEGIIINSDYFGVCESSNLSSWSANSTSDIEDSHSGFDTRLRRKEMLVSGYSLVEGFAFVVTTEMEL